VSHGQSAQEPQSLTGTSDHGADHEVVTTLFDLERQVTAVLDLEELLHQIPRLIARLISFEAFAVYLLDERKGELRVPYSIGYPLSDATRNGWEKEVRFAQRVQAALLPAGPPKRLKGVDIAAAFASARELGGDFHDYLAPESHTRRCGAALSAVFELRTRTRSRRTVATGA
jgi:serine phosphatase RsbU (regulator of sigma subunit)